MIVSREWCHTMTLTYQFASNCIKGSIRVQIAFIRNGSLVRLAAIWTSDWPPKSTAPGASNVLTRTIIITP